MAVIELRGTNGAGKSTIVHSLLTEDGKTPIYLDHYLASGKNSQKVLGYHLHKIDCAICGTYETQCGGCDSIKTADDIEQRIRKFAGEYKHVIAEGITLSHTFGRYNELAVDLGDYYFLFLTTPVEVCIKRVLQRRREKGNTKPFDPYKKMGLVTDYERVQVAYRKLKAAGRNVIDLDYLNPMPQVMELLK